MRLEDVLSSGHADWHSTGLSVYVQISPRLLVTRTYDTITSKHIHKHILCSCTAPPGIYCSALILSDFITTPGWKCFDNRHSANVNGSSL
jgi:hypothetical protein